VSCVCLPGSGSKKKWDPEDGGADRSDRSLSRPEFPNAQLIQMQRLDGPAISSHKVRSTNPACIWPQWVETPADSIPVCKTIKVMDDQLREENIIVFFMVVN
jgi:hypothetical protein